MENEINIKLVAAFKGVTFIPPPFVLGHNNLNPKLVLKNNSIEFKSLLFTQEKQYSEIKNVDIFINTFKLFGVATTNIILTFHHSIFTFSGNLNDDSRLKELLKFLKAKECPLSRQAQLLID